MTAESQTLFGPDEAIGRADAPRRRGPGVGGSYDRLVVLDVDGTGRMDSTGWVRLRAWNPVFSSTPTTAACSVAFMHSLKAARTFSTKNWSSERLKVEMSHGRHRRWTRQMSFQGLGSAAMVRPVATICRIPTGT